MSWPGVLSWLMSHVLSDDAGHPAKPTVLALGWHPFSLFARSFSSTSSRQGPLCAASSAEPSWCLPWLKDNCWSFLPPPLSSPSCPTLPVRCPLQSPCPVRLWEGSRGQLVPKPCVGGRQGGGGRLALLRLPALPALHLPARCSRLMSGPPVHLQQGAPLKPRGVAWEMLFLAVTALCPPCATPYRLRQYR
jgi:hypothetical protein